MSICRRPNLFTYPDEPLAHSAGADVDKLDNNLRELQGWVRRIEKQQGLIIERLDKLEEELEKQ